MTQAELPSAIQDLLDQLAAQQLDTNVALRTVEAMLELGYRIEPPTACRSDGVASLTETAEQIENANLAGLMAIWRARDAQLWSRSLSLYCRLGERVLNLGAPYLALDVANEGLEHWPTDIRLRQIQGLAWARSGVPEQANRILGDLVRSGLRDEESLGMLARTHKDFAALAKNPPQHDAHLRTAQKIYEDAFRLTGGYWTGINAATLATLLGDAASAAELATIVRQMCQTELRAPAAEGHDRYWLLATLGEAELNLRDWSAAERWYREAAEASRNRLGDRHATLRQARQLLECLGHDRAWIDALLPIPKVALFVGHMSDRPGRAKPRFPVQLQDAVRAAIRARLLQENALIGYSSAACGSDILFVETLLTLGGEPHIVLPYDRESFARDSVDIIAGADWRQRYDAVLEQAADVATASTHRLDGDSIFYDYANLILRGQAFRRAKELETEIVGIAVWDGKPGDAPGGTASAVEHWQTLGLKIEHIDLADLLRQHCPESATIEDPPTTTYTASPTLVETSVKAILFADAVKFSKFSESEVVNFSKHCVGAIADLLERSPTKAAAKETRGDGVYLVFDTARDAGVFALALRDLMRETRWEDYGLPKELRLRIGLHAGPVCRCYDRILEGWTFTGTHVSRAARIEPITPPGEVYASEAFAALAMEENCADFNCDYVRQVALAKDYGIYPTYVVRRRRSDE